MKTKHWLYATIAVGLALRIFDLITVYSIGMDGIEYARIAELFAKGDFGLALKNVRMPFYPMIMACFHFFISDMEWAGRLVSFSFGLLLVLLCFFFVKKFWGEETALFTTAAVAIHPYLVRYSIPVLSESLATFLFTASVFCFYRGWKEQKSTFLACSGIFLTLSYFTRPEYLIYFVPLTAILIIEKKHYRYTGIFISAFLFLVAAYLVWVRVDSGFWVIDKKMLLWRQQPVTVVSSFYYLFGPLSPQEVLNNLPRVAGYFGEAVYLPFLLLAFLGLTKTEQPYRKLVFLLVAVHILARSFIPYSTKRYSVEFAPMIMILTAQGALVFRDRLKQYRQGGLFTALFFSIIVLVAVFMGFNTEKAVRKLEREAGLRLADKGAKIIAARLPVSAYYAGTDWVDLTKIAQTTGTCDKLLEAIQLQRVEYLILDKSLERDVPFVRDCFAGKEPVSSFTDQGSYVKVYKVLLPARTP